MDYELIKKLYGIEQLQGCLVEDLDYLIKKFGEVPSQVIRIFKAIGGTQQLNRVQDEWLFPDKYRKYTWMDDDIYKDSFMAMLIYQSVFAMEYSPEDFFWYSEADVQVIRRKMTKLPYKLYNWYSEITEFYTNADDNMLYIMSDDNQGTYRAVTEASYEKIESVLGELGEGRRRGTIKVDKFLILIYNNITNTCKTTA